MENIKTNKYIDYLKSYIEAIEGYNSYLKNFIQTMQEEDLDTEDMKSFEEYLKFVDKII